MEQPFTAARPINESGSGGQVAEGMAQELTQENKQSIVGL